MRRLTMVLLLASTLLTALLTGCGAAVSENSPQPSTLGVQDARNYMAGQEPPVTEIKGEPVHEAIVISTMYSYDSWNGENWSAVLLHPDGTIHVVRPAFSGGFVSDLRPIMTPGAYLVYVDTDGYITKYDVQVLAPAAVNVGRLSPAPETDR